MKRLGRRVPVARGVAAAVAAVVLAVALAGCQAANASAGTPAPTTPPSVGASAAPPSPAALAGGACLLMDYDTVHKALGIAFTVAAAADTSGSYTCVLRAVTANLPTLVLAITATDLSAAEFLTDVQPAGATAVTSLGKVGYVRQLAAASGAGPAIEVGWLSGNDRLITLRYTSPKGTAADQLDGLTTQMVGLARHVDATTV